MGSPLPHNKFAYRNILWYAIALEPFPENLIVLHALVVVLCFPVDLRHLDRSTIWVKEVEELAVNSSILQLGEATDVELSRVSRNGSTLSMELIQERS